MIYKEELQTSVRMMNNQPFRNAITYAYDHMDEPFSINQIAAALNTSQIHLPQF